MFPTKIIPSGQGKSMHIHPLIFELETTSISTREEALRLLTAKREEFINFCKDKKVVPENTSVMNTRYIPKCYTDNPEKITADGEEI